MAEAGGDQGRARKVRRRSLAISDREAAEVLLDLAEGRIEHLAAQLEELRLALRDYAAIVRDGSKNVQWTPAMVRRLREIEVLAASAKP